ncbi:MAG: metabolite traffic protein EboE [Planctomycetes bacterium]|nr:metabolite traffic protein EboE [Planctomycetota bacterium]
MRLVHRDHPGRSVRLAYCLNLHPAGDLDQYLKGLRRITLPLRERLSNAAEFGVGMYLPAKLARELASDASQFDRLRNFLESFGLDPFTYNAFPSGDFDAVGLKARVFEPTWFTEQRLQYTLDVAQLAARLGRCSGSERHVSISTHTGAHSSAVPPSERGDACRRAFANWVASAIAFARLERDWGTRLVLALEPEPRALVESLLELRLIFDAERELRRSQSESSAAIARHLGLCLDTCHAAVEYEDLSVSSLQSLAMSGAGVGKLQFTSALSVHDPSGNDFGRRALFDLDDPRYLHQVTGQGPDAVARAGDLPELREAWADPRSAWHDCSEWRCHFHVPVDLEALAGSGLSTTRDYADRVLREELRAPALWGAHELHVEIETYTWDVLPREARGSGELVDGLEREYRHVLAMCAAEGWCPG